MNAFNLAELNMKLLNLKFQKLIYTHNQTVLPAYAVNIKWNTCCAKVHISMNIYTCRVSIEGKLILLIESVYILYMDIILQCKT